MGSIISAILAICKVIPTIDNWVQQLSSAYVSSQLTKMSAENVAAIRLALTQHDQRGIEGAIGNTSPGLASGDAGAVIQKDPPPGV